MGTHPHPEAVLGEGPDVLQAVYDAHPTYSEGLSADEVADS